MTRRPNLTSTEKRIIVTQRLMGDPLWLLAKVFNCSTCGIRMTLARMNVPTGIRTDFKDWKHDFHE